MVGTLDTLLQDVLSSPSSQIGLQLLSGQDFATAAAKGSQVARETGQRTRQEQQRKALNDAINILGQKGIDIGSPEFATNFSKVARELKIDANTTFDVLNSTSKLSTQKQKTGLQTRKIDLEERKFDEEIKKAQQGLLSSEETFKRAKDLRGSFINLSKEFVKQRDSFARISASTTDPSAAGDLALIFNFMKLLDPGSVVRESEFATAANAAGVPDRIRNTFNKILRGERLAVNQRQDFVGRAEKLFQKANLQHTKRIKSFSDLAGLSGVPKEQVTIDLSLAEEEAKTDDFEAKRKRFEELKAKRGL